uniref:Interleukin-17C n=1 Tax=Varanus komodoensis TaxID=61221 RepID=A0A8D2LEV5_VARKO
MPAETRAAGRGPAPILPADSCSGWLATGGADHHHHHSRRHCFSPEDLKDGELPRLLRSRTARWDRHSSLQLVPHLESEQASPRRQRRQPSQGCPDLKLQDILNKEVNERSISPWRYRIDEDENRYPRKLAFAECLCEGCVDVKTGRETTSLNSVPIIQSMMVLQRKPCQHNGEAAGFTFEVQYLDVPVACACVLPRSSS